MPPPSKLALTVESKQGESSMDPLVAVQESLSAAEVKQVSDLVVVSGSEISEVKRAQADTESAAAEITRQFNGWRNLRKKRKSRILKKKKKSDTKR